MKKSLENVTSLLNKKNKERDLLALELREALSFLYEVLGKNLDEQILDKIFKTFCIGK